jgi:formylglycine-generating enzyme required for sulfatase activity
MRRGLSIIIVLIFLFGCEKWELPEYLLSDSLGNDNIPRMVTIPGGSFQMGSNNGNPTKNQYIL